MLLSLPRTITFGRLRIDLLDAAGRGSRERDLERAIDLAMPLIPDGDARRHLAVVRRGWLAASPWVAWWSRNRWVLRAVELVLAALAIVVIAETVWFVIWLNDALNDPLLRAWGRVK